MFNDGCVLNIVSFHSREFLKTKRSSERAAVVDAACLGGEDEGCKTVLLFT